MRLHAAAAVLVAVGLAPAQEDIIHYRFDTGGGDQVINHAPPNSFAAGEAVITTILSDSWAPGRFGSALRAAVDDSGFERDNWIDTGWRGEFRGDFTVSMFVKYRENVWGPLFGSGNGGVQGYLGFQSPTEYVFLLTGLGYRISNPRIVLTPVIDRWRHLAFVARGTLGQFFIDGVPRPVFSLGRTPLVNETDAPFTVGGSGRADHGYDIDEFRFSLRAASASEIQAWASRAPATHAPYGVGCGGIGERGGWLGATASAGLPVFGNAGYAFEIHGFPGSAFAISVGSDRLRFAGTPLPFDLGAINPAWTGCAWWTSADIGTLTGQLNIAGRASAAVPVPNLTELEGVSVWSQGAILHGPSSTFMLTNGFCSAIGR